MSAPRPSEADVEALGCRHGRPENVRCSICANDTLPIHAWDEGYSKGLAARGAEHEREVAALRERLSSRTVGMELIHEAQEATDRAEAAERALADLLAAIKELAAMWVCDEDDGSEHVVGCHDYRCRECVVIACASDLRALLPRDDAAGAGGGS